ncbi:MAG: FtsW/RodA/SpoVE family cell cycle protein [Coriobacteriales bacterium]|nr:FtsW/RodA/SpoVE family cell cycle protein [Coriobacteriales bacterium]
MRNPRNIELALLLAAAPPVLIAFGLVDASQSETLAWASFIVPLLLLAAFAAAHLAVRVFAPAADPGLLPITFALSGIGLAFVTRLDPELAASQVVWLFAGVAALVVTLIAVRSLEALARYKYSIMLLSIALLVLPVLPGIGREINGARLWLNLGPFSFQPGEIAKVLIVIFLAAYLAEKREMLSVSTKRVLGVWVPPARALGPVLLMWMASLFVLVFERDLGSSLLLFGIFLVMIYVATGRAEYVATGLLLFAGGATLAWRLFDHVKVRVDIWLHPFEDAAGRGYQLVQSLFSLAAGGFTGAGIGRGLPTRIPFVETDFIFSAIGEEIGLLGAAALLVGYLVFSLRGLATASRARSDMAAFTAAGLVAAVVLQTFVIVGGVTRLIPLTGVTLPFVSYGGSSLLSSFIILGLLLRAGDDGTGEAVAMQLTSTSGFGDGGVLGRLALKRRLVRTAQAVSIMIAALVVNLTFVQVVQAPALAANPNNTRNLADQLRQDRGSILTSDGTILAESVPSGDSFERRYPEGEFASHTVGYYSARYGRAGTEAAENDALAGRREFRSVGDAMDAWLGRPVKGNDVVLTIRDDVQQAAIDSIEGYRGACVVLDPKTGAVLASASNPGFDPNNVDEGWEQLSSDTGPAPLVDRSRSARYPPGSTFKVVTLTGVLGSGTSSLEREYRGPGRMEIGNAPVTNFEGGSYDRISLRDATARSVNTVFAQAAVELGAEKLVSQAEGFGFNKRVPYELPARTSLMPNPAEMTTWETAWAGVGQPVGEHESPPGPQSTVLQMAEVASGIANNGRVMRPHVVEKIADPAGRTLATTRPRLWTTATDPTTAAEVRDVMVYTVSNGSGAAAQIDGVEVGGKTGTAEVGKGLETNAWFIAFAPAEDPTVAMAIMLEQGGVGGRRAAPRAKPVLEAALASQAQAR